MILKMNVLPVLLLVLTLGHAVIGQDDEKDVHVGFKGGFSLPNLVGGSDEEITRNYKSRFAVNFGAFVDIGLSRNVSFQTGVDYAPQGGKREGIQPITAPLPGLPPPPIDYYYGDFKNTAKLHYLEVPAMFKYTWRRKTGPQPYINGGPYFGFLMKATQVTRGSSTIYIDNSGTPLLLPPFNQPLPPMPFDADTDVTDSLHRFNFGLTGGGGLRFPHNENYFFVDARASYGLTTLQKNTATDGTSRTGNLVISFGYAFKVKGR